MSMRYAQKTLLSHGVGDAMYWRTKEDMKEQPSKTNKEKGTPMPSTARTTRTHAKINAQHEEVDNSFRQEFCNTPIDEIHDKTDEVGIVDDDHIAGYDTAKDVDNLNELSNIKFSSMEGYGIDRDISSFGYLPQEEDVGLAAPSTKRSINKSTNRNKTNLKINNAKSSTNDQPHMRELIQHLWLYENTHPKPTGNDNTNKHGNSGTKKKGYRANKASQIRQIANVPAVETSPKDLWQMPKFTKGAEARIEHQWDNTHVKIDAGKEKTEKVANRMDEMIGTDEEADVCADDDFGETKDPIFEEDTELNIMEN